MNICFVSMHAPGVNGVGTAAFNQAEAMARRGHNVVLVNGPGTGPPTREKKLKVVQIRPRPTGLSMLWSLKRRISRTAAEKISPMDVDIVKFSKTLGASMDKIAGENGVEVVVFSESFMESIYVGALKGVERAVKFTSPRYLFQKLNLTDRPVNETLDRLDRASVGRADVMYSPSKAMASLVSDYYGIPGENIGVVPEAVDTDRFVPIDDEGDEFIILFVGRFSAEKGADAAVEVVPRLLARHSNAVFKIIGPCGEAGGKKYADILREKAGPGCAGRIIHREFVVPGDMPREYGTASLLFLPSRFESFGMAAAEAQACGLPAVVSGAGGLPEIVVDGETGCVVENGAEGYVDAVEEFIGDEKKTEAFSKRAREHAVLNFSYEKVSERLEKIMDKHE